MPKLRFLGDKGIRIPIATKLILSFLLVILVIGVVFMAVGVQIIGNRIVDEAQEKVRHDLNAAREIYLGKLRHISDVIRLTADRALLIDVMLSGDVDYARTELRRVQDREGLDFLTITDPFGIVLLRTGEGAQTGDSLSADKMISAALTTNEAVAGTVIVSADDLARESPALAERAHLVFIDTPMARERPEKEETSGMVLMAAAPIYDRNGYLLGVVSGGVLLNRNYEVVDKIKQTVFEGIQYKGQDIGTSTIFQDDVRISTNVRNSDGSRAIGTRVSKDVYQRVVLEGKLWVGRAYVVNNWYITAYEPIQDPDGAIIGILYVGLLEQKYVDIRAQMVIVFLGITVTGTMIALALSYFIARMISGPINRLATAAREVARGNLDAQVTPSSNDELGELAEGFNRMACALKERDRQLKDFTTKKIMESEKLALIGQLSANVAHELNNPLQGIVTYSHLLLEKLPPQDPAVDSLRKIVTQADRSRDIIRGLLDFARQRKPDKTVCDVNTVLRECLALVEQQASFQNIEIEQRLEEGLPLAVIDPSQIERVFINMIINAAEAMDEGGRLHLSTRFDPQEKLIEVEFTDTGHGIPEDDLDRIFDPFFTTKDVGHGTGLGLAISYGIVKEHGGTISVESRVGQGTTFTVRLPVTTAKEGLADGRQA